jgi:hypothetical protein
VVADADAVSIAEGDAGVEPLALHVDFVRRPQVRNHDTGTGIDDDGVVPADVRVVENDVVVGQATDPGSRSDQRVFVTGRVAKPRGLPTNR